MTTPFDDETDATIIRLLDATEEWLVTNEICPAEEAHALLTRDYIACAAGICDGATCYIVNDEHIAASIFLSRLPGAKAALRSSRRADACAKMLLDNPQNYFPEYGTMLRYFFNRELERTYPKSLRANGLVNLAAATLRGARAQIRRENRRRNDCEGLVVTDTDMLRRLLPSNCLDSILATTLLEQYNLR